MRGKLIVIEGTDCSGKETQTKLLVEKLTNDNRKVKRYSFPMYDTPTGKIVGGPYLGKSYICDGWFNEGATNVDSKVASLYYAADRLYNIKHILEDLDDGYDIILDRYIYSNMAHQGAKINSYYDRLNMYKWLETLEFDLLNLPEPDIKIFLHMPTEYSCLLKEGREEASDQHESDVNHLICAEKAYQEIAAKYSFETVECVNSSTSTIEDIRTIDDINNDVYNIVNRSYNLTKK